MPTNIPSTISGITFSQAKRIAKSEFDIDMIKIVMNVEEPCYDVYVNEQSIDKKKIDKFKKTWNQAFRIIPLRIGDPIK